MLSLPSNLLPWLIASIASGILGAKGWSSYKKTGSTTSKYFALIGLSASVSWLFWTIPFGFFEDRFILLALITVGDTFYYFLLFILARCFWYVTLEKYNFWILGVPTLILSVLGLFFAIYSGIDSAYPAVVDGQAVYPLSTTSSVIQAILIPISILLGISLVVKSLFLKNTKSRAGTIAVGLLIAGVGSGGLVNILYNVFADSGETNNDSPVIFYLYIGAFIVFIGTMLIFQISKLLKKS